jgi:hypothetical protein
VGTDRAVASATQPAAHPPCGTETAQQSCCVHECPVHPAERAAAGLVVTSDGLCRWHEMLAGLEVPNVTDHARPDSKYHVGTSVQWAPIAIILAGVNPRDATPIDTLIDA